MNILEISHHIDFENLGLQPIKNLNVIVPVKKKQERAEEHLFTLVSEVFYNEWFEFGKNLMREIECSEGRREFLVFDQSRKKVLLKRVYSRLSEYTNERMVYSIFNMSFVEKELIIQSYETPSSNYDTMEMSLFFEKGFCTLDIYLSIIKEIHFKDLNIIFVNLSRILLTLFRDANITHGKINEKVIWLCLDGINKNFSLKIGDFRFAKRIRGANRENKLQGKKEEGVADLGESTVMLSDQTYLPLEDPDFAVEDVRDMGLIFKNILGRCKSTFDSEDEKNQYEEWKKISSLMTDESAPIRMTVFQLIESFIHFEEAKIFISRELKLEIISKIIEEDEPKRNRNEIHIGQILALENVSMASEFLVLEEEKINLDPELKKIKGESDENYYSRLLEERNTQSRHGYTYLQNRILIFLMKKCPFKNIRVRAQCHLIENYCYMSFWAQAKKLKDELEISVAPNLGEYSVLTQIFFYRADIVYCYFKNRNIKENIKNFKEMKALIKKNLLDEFTKIQVWINILQIYGDLRMKLNKQKTFEKTIEMADQFLDYLNNNKNSDQKKFSNFKITTGYLYVIKLRIIGRNFHEIRKNPLKKKTKRMWSLAIFALKKLKKIGITIGQIKDMPPFGIMKEFLKTELKRKNLLKKITSFTKRLSKLVD